MSLSFDMGEDLEDIVEAVHAFAVDQIRPQLREFEAAGELSQELAQGCHELGVTTFELPEELGGMDVLDLRAAALCSEELAWGDLGAAVGVPGAGSAGFLVQQLGSPAQVKRLLEPFACEDEGWQRHGTLALVEGPFGVEPATVETTARREGDQYLLSGTKRYVRFGGQAALTVVLAQLEGSQAADPWDRLAAFALEGSPAGLQAEERNKTLGLHTVPYVTLALDDVKVPAGNRLGEGAAGELLQALQRTWARKKTLDAARLVGCARAASEYAFQYAQERKTFGVYLYEHQALAFMMADMNIRTDAMRTLVWQAAAAQDQGQAGAYGAARRAHAYAMEQAVEVATDAVQILGGHGYLWDHPLEKWMRDIRTLGLVDGFSFPAELEPVAAVG